MMSVKPANINIFISVLICIFSACSSTQLEKRSSALNLECDIFDTSSVTGTGLKLDGHAYQPRKCIKSSDASTTGGVLNFEFIDPSAVLSGERGPHRDFIKSALLRASKYNISGMKPFSIACIVSVSGRMNYLIDNSIQLTDLAESFLKKNDLDGFYRLCGTQFIDSTLFESDLVFVVTYYIPPEETYPFSSRIEYGKKLSTSDIINFSIFREAGNRYPVFFSVSGSSDNLFIPLEFPMASVYGYGSEDFIKKVIQSCLASTSGRTTSFQLKKWVELPDVNRYLPKSKGIMFREDAHNNVEALTQEMRDYSLFRINPEMRELEKNDKKINELIKKISWGDFYKCGWGVKYNSYINPEQENDCKDLLQGLKIYAEIENYKPLIDSSNDNDILSMDNFKELRLVDKTTLSGETDYSESEYRFNDKTLYVNIPEKVTAGQTMDASGKLYASDCIKKESVTFISNKTGGISSIRNDCYPVEMREWGLLKRMFFFREKPPPGKPLYRGNLEISGFSEALSNDFIITDDAAELARKDIIKFYEKYGTHYVSQVRGRRGLIYYFSLDSAEDREIRVESYGLSLTAPGQTDTPIPTSIDGGCLFSFIGNLMNQKKEEPLLHPATVKEFFKTKDDFVKIIKEGSESVPVELYLKPWSQYLVERGIIRIDQTVPVSLSGNRRGDATEGMAVITDSNGDLYEGMLSNGLKNGYGVLKTRLGSVYEGEWYGDLMHGRGTYKHRDGNVYTGDFMYGYPHGTGENKSISGNIYKGSVIKGKITGQGELLYRDGRRYRGEFLDGEPDGYGIMEFPDGKKVEGNFRKGLFFK